MAEIRKFTGFIAPDGSTHDTIKKATEHTRNLKIKAALDKAFGNAVPGNQPLIQQDDRDLFVLPADFIPQFIFDNREAILACFKQDVKLRESRKPKAATAAPAAGA